MRFVVIFCFVVCFSMMRGSLLAANLLETTTRSIIYDTALFNDYYHNDKQCNRDKDRFACFPRYVFNNQIMFTGGIKSNDPKYKHYGVSQYMGDVKTGIEGDKVLIPIGLSMKVNTLEENTGLNLVSDNIFSFNIGYVYLNSFQFQLYYYYLKPIAFNEDYKTNSKDKFLYRINSPKLKLKVENIPKSDLADINKSEYFNIEKLVNIYDGVVPMYYIIGDTSHDSFSANYLLNGLRFVFSKKKYISASAMTLYNPENNTLHGIIGDLVLGKFKYSATQRIMDKNGRRKYLFGYGFGFIIKIYEFFLMEISFYKKYLPHVDVMPEMRDAISLKILLKATSKNVSFLSSENYFSTRRRLEMDH